MGYELQSLDRGLRMISLLATDSPTRLTDLADRLGTTPTTALRTLRVLEQHGYVRRSSNNEYLLGAKLVELGAAAAESFDLTTAIRPFIAALSREFDVTAHTGMLRDRMITVVDKVDSPDSPVRYSALGTRMPLHATAAGKAALALMGLTDFDALNLTEPLRPYTQHSFTSIAELRQDIEMSIARGYSVEREEYNMGFCCVGTAVAFGEDLFTVSLSGKLVDSHEIAERGRRLLDTMQLLLDGYHGALRGLTASIAGPRDVEAASGNIVVAEADGPR